MGKRLKEMSHVFLVLRTTLSVGSSLLDGAYVERDKLKLWEEGGKKLLNPPD